MKQIQSTGKTLDVAVEKGLEQLGLDRSKVQIEVLQEGGFLRPFKVQLTQILSEAEKIEEFLENVLEKMGIADCVVTSHDDKETLFLDIAGENSSGAIGYRGEVLDALQYLCSLLLNGKHDGFKRVVIDTENYRAKREKTLQRLALNLEQKVKRTGQPVKLEPMNPYERRIIHTALQNSKHVSTESQGNGSGRHVVISPKLQSNVLNSPNAPRKTLNFVYRSDKKRRK